MLDNTQTSQEARWYVIHTYSGYERTVCNTIIKYVVNRGLQNMIQAVFIPMETVTEVTGTGTKVVERKDVYIRTETVTKITDKDIEADEDIKADEDANADKDAKPGKGAKKGKSSKTEERRRLIFPGYVLVKMVLTDETWHIVRNIRGVTGFVGDEDNAIPLTDEEIAALGVDKTEVTVPYQVGATVRITDGPLNTFLGVVDELDVGKNRVRVTVSMFGRETPVELELNQVEQVEPV